MINKGTAIVGFILSFLAGLMLMWAIDSRRAATGSDDGSTEGKWSDEASPVPVTSDDPVWGSRAAPVTVVEFSDFECPYCSMVEKTVDQVKTTYGKDRVRIVWKHNPLPFHKSARPAAVAAETVRVLGGSDAFWKFHDTAFKNQKELTRENFEKWAQEAGVKLDKFKQALDQNTYAAKVDADIAVGRQVGVEGTPHFLINGVELGGAQPFDKFKEVIDAQLKKAQGLLASGTQPARLYVELTKLNRSSEPKPRDTAPTVQKKPDQPPEDTTVWKVPIGNSPVLGSKNAAVTVVVFSDFQCPFCKGVEDTIRQLRKDYGDKLRIVWKDRPLPFHAQAEPAAELAREARRQKGDAGFWAAHDKLFENNTNLKDTDLEGYAKDLGLDVAKVKEVISKKKYEADIEADQELGNSLNISGTPCLFFNGRRLVGNQPLDTFKTLINDQLTKAQELVKSGTPADKVYDKLMESAVSPPPPPPLEKKDVPAPTSDSPSKGGANAKVVIQIFSDFQCPFCKRVEETLKQVEQQYGKKVRFVWRNKPLPMHPKAQLAAEASMEAFAQKGSDGFWKYHDKLFEKQDTPDGLDRPALESYAEGLGLDMTKFRVALDAHGRRTAVEADSKVADAAGISGTPSFAINGYFISGAQPLREFTKLIDLALKEAK